MSTWGGAQSSPTKPAERTLGLGNPSLFREEFLIRKQILIIGRKKTFKAHVAVSAMTGMRWSHVGKVVTLEDAQSQGFCCCWNISRSTQTDSSWEMAEH